MSSSFTAVSGVTAPSGSRLPFLHSVSSRKKKLKVKFVRADITYSGNSHPIFTNIDAMFVNLMNDNADLNSMMALVRSEYGPNFTIAGNDGLQIKDSQYIFHVRQLLAFLDYYRHLFVFL